MKKIFAEHGIEINEYQIDLFTKYYKLLIEWNQKMNLTAITDFDEVVKKHFLDSCLILKKYLPDQFFSGKKVLDLGSGAGFPGIPLAIFLPNTEICLMDSLKKRTDFLSEVVSQLGLKNVQVVQGRAEELGRRDEYREKYDICVSRAVAFLPTLLEYCIPFIKVKGRLFLYKSKKINIEIEESENALHLLKCDVIEVVSVGEKMKEQKNRSTYNEEYERYIIEVKKNETTPSQYPRKLGKPKKHPL